MASAAGTPLPVSRGSAGEVVVGGGVTVLPLSPPPPLADGAGSASTTWMTPTSWG